MLAKMLLDGKGLKKKGKELSDSTTVTERKAVGNMNCFEDDPNLTPEMQQKLMRPSTSECAAGGQDGLETKEKSGDT